MMTVISFTKLNIGGVNYTQHHLASRSCLTFEHTVSKVVKLYNFRVSTGCSVIHSSYIRGLCSSP